MRGIRAGALAVTIGLLVAACSSGGSDASSSATAPANAVTISTVSGLRPLVDKLVAGFNQAHPADPVTIRNDDGRAVIASTLHDRTALVAIAPSALLAGQQVDQLGRNVAVIAVPSGNPARVSDLQAFRTGTSARTQVCGGPSYLPVFIRFVLQLSRVQADPATIADDEQCPGRAMLKLAAGQLDAALLFRNAAVVPPGVRLVEIPTDRNLVFPFGVTKVTSTQVSDAFVDFLGSDQAKKILTENGYLP